MKILIGWMLGVVSAWAALAIWRTVPPLGPIDPGDEWEPRRGDRRPPYRDAIAGGVVHDEGCAYESGRPCVCSVMFPAHGGFGSP